MSGLGKAKEFNKELFIYRLNDLMYSRGISAAQLSRASGVQNYLISNYLKGNTTPNLSNIVKISSVLNVSIDYLLGLDGEVIKKVSEIKGLSAMLKGASAQDIEKKADEIINMYSGSRL